MSGGRKLQDIFNGGTKRLEQLEQAERQSLETSASQAVESCGRKESQILQRMETGLNEEEAQILSYTAAALETVQLAISAEREENDRFYASVSASLSLSLQSLTDDISRVRESLVQKSSNEAAYKLALFETEMRTLTSHLRANGLYAAEQLHAQSRERFLTFTSKMESIAAGLFERESRVPSELHAGFAEHVQAAYQTLASQSSLFAEQVEQHLGAVDAAAQELAHALEAQVNENTIALDFSFESAEARLRASYESVLSTGLQMRHALSGELFDEFQRGLESGNVELASKLEDFRADSQTVLEHMQTAVTAMDIDLHDRARGLSLQMEDALTSKLDAGRSNRELVANERIAMLEKTSKDLKEIESGFESRLSDISRDCLSRLSTICLDAETSIITAHDNCVKEFRTAAESTQVDMENRTAQLLSELQQAEQVAISRIAEAAGETGESV